MAVMGHSMGGGGALLAAAEHGDEIVAAIPFTPWEPEADLSGVTVPTLIIAGSADEIAPVGEHAWRHYQLISSAEKVYMELEGGGHFLADSERGPDLATVGRYALAWLGLQLDGDERYRDYLYEVGPAADAQKLSRYVTHP
jgi:triacylglycerol lipase